MDNTNNFPPHNKPSLEKIYWQDIRAKIKQIAPDFAKLVDDLDPGKKFPLYRARYPYGSVIVDEGTFYLPTPDGELAPLQDARIAKEVQEDLGYTAGEIPAGMVLNNSMELLCVTKDTILPWLLYDNGTLFSLWRYLDKSPSYHPPKMFTIIAGARSIFMLPNIGASLYHKNLMRDYGVRLHPAKDLMSQWPIFTAITRHTQSNCTWHTDILFFSQNWLEKLNSDDPAWLLLEKFLLKLVWEKSAYFRNKIFYDFAFSQMQALRNLRPNPYLADTVKHLVAIGLGVFPGFAPPLDESSAPITFLQKAFLESYGLKDYCPTFLLPTYFSLQEILTRPVYYSLRFPTTMEFSPKSRKNPVALHDLRELQHLLKVYREELLNGRLKIDGTPLELLAQNIQFDFFHTEDDCYGYVQPTTEMPKFDSTLLLAPKGYDKRKFAGDATFLRGCIRLALKEK